MAGTDGSVSESERCPPSLFCKEGPVLSMMSKRLRALKKKYNKILQIEESKVQGKVINKEQEEVLKTKIAVAALIDEYEKLRQPLLVAVKEELAEREKELMAATLLRDEGGEEETMAGEEKDAEVPEVSEQKPLAEVRKESDMQDAAVCSSENAGSNADKLEEAPSEPEHANDTSSGLHVTNGNIGDLLTFLYFAQLFDVRSHGETSSSVLWTKAHERSSCLSYDCVTEDETSPLLESDLDDLSLFGSLLTSRPPNATLSHRDALQHCIEHAKLWQQNFDGLIREDLDLTYSRLRERLNRILSSEYFTMIPELQTVTQQTAVAAASATAQYASQLLIHKAGDGPALDDAIVYFSPQEHTSQQPPYHIGEHYPSQPLAATASFDASEVHFGTNSSEISNEDKVDSRALPDDDRQSLPNGVQHEHDGSKATDSLQHEGLQEHEGQPQEQGHVPNVSVGPRGHQGPKGGGRGNNHATGGRGRGYANGRGGRNGGGRGGYGNGWSGQYYDQGGYYPRSYNGRGGGRGTRGGNSTYNGYTNGQAARATNNTPA